MKKKFKRSLQREKILEALRGTTTHPTAEWVFEQVKPQIPELSLGTVYRNLNILVEMGEVKEVPGADSVRRFDGFTHPHPHFVCQRCGSVYDVEATVSREMLGNMAENLPHRVDNVELTLFGICKNCLNRFNN
ncbi:MAG: transcriptional repressor [Calditrichia bacterium]